MTVNRIHRKQNNFSIILNEGAQDTKLDWDAKGLLWYLCTKPDGWEVIEGDLIKQTLSSGIKAIRSILKKLECAGYLVRWCERVERGYLKWRSEIFESKEDARQWTKDNLDLLQNAVRLAPGTASAIESMYPEREDGFGISSMHPLGMDASRVHPRQAHLLKTEEINNGLKQKLTKEKTECDLTRPREKPKEPEKTANTHTEILDADFWEAEHPTPDTRHPIAAESEIIEQPQQPQSSSQPSDINSLRCQSDQKISAEAIVPHETKVPPLFSEQGINPIEVLRQIEPDRSSFEYRNLPSVVKQELQFGKTKFYPWNKDSDTLRLFMAFLVNSMGTRLAESERKSIASTWIRKANATVPQMSKRDYSVVMSRWAEFIENAQTATSVKEVQGKKLSRIEEMVLRATPGLAL